MAVQAGVDEAGRGALAGPVVAVAVILTPEIPIDLLHDSKKMTEAQREEAYSCILKNSPYISVGILSHRMIDKINILQATLMAMKRAVLGLSLMPEIVLIDGNRAPLMPGYTIQTIVKGDETVPAISAASIVAKVTRDRIMSKLHTKFPQYNFDQHKGYGTQGHYDQLFKWGTSNVHRLSFNLTRQESLF